jgi:tRNA pseudouridine38-40 synthase
MKTHWTQAREAKDEWCFEVQANSFLYRMVRRLVFVQVAVAQGKVSADSIALALGKQKSAGARNENIPAGLAPAHGLTLVEVTYDESIGQ